MSKKLVPADLRPPYSIGGEARYNNSQYRSRLRKVKNITFGVAEGGGIGLSANEAEMIIGHDNDVNIISNTESIFLIAPNSVGIDGGAAVSAVGDEILMTSQGVSMTLDTTANGGDFEVLADGVINLNSDSLISLTSDGDIEVVGDNWVLPVAFTPSHNITLGSGGSATGAYAVTNGIVHVEARFILGTAPTMPTNPEFTLPVSGTFLETNMPMGEVICNESGGSAYPGSVIMPDADTVRMFRFDVSGSLVRYNTITSTTPFTWAINDRLCVKLRYRQG